MHNGGGGGGVTSASLGRREKLRKGEWRVRLLRRHGWREGEREGRRGGTGLADAVTPAHGPPLIGAETLGAKRCTWWLHCAGVAVATRVVGDAYISDGSKDPPSSGLEEGDVIRKGGYFGTF